MSIFCVSPKPKQGLSYLFANIHEHSENNVDNELLKPKIEKRSQRNKQKESKLMITELNSSSTA